MDQPSSLYHTLTTVCLVSSTIIRSSLTALGPIIPLNSAALLSPTGVRVKILHGGGGCPVTVGELHSPVGGDDITQIYMHDFITQHHDYNECCPTQRTYYTH